MEKLKLKSQLVIFKIDTAYVLDDGYVRPTAYRDVLSSENGIPSSIFPLVIITIINVFEAVLIN